MQVTGLVHDLGKLLYLFGSEYVCASQFFHNHFFKSSCCTAEASGTSSAYEFTFPCNFDNSFPVFQDTFVVGCAFSDKIVLPETFAGNPDSTDAVYSTKYGVYAPHCGLENVMLSWGHDEVRLTFLPYPERTLVT